MPISNRIRPAATNPSWPATQGTSAFAFCTPDEVETATVST